jgi:hypothetical protein
LVSVGLAAATVVAVRAWSGSGSLPRAAPSTPPNLDTLGAQPGASSSPFKLKPAWPTAPGACGTDVPLPILASAPVAERTGIRLLLGGARLRVVDFDSGRASPLPGARLRSGESVDQFDPGSITYAVAGPGGCRGQGQSHVLRIDASGHNTTVASLGVAEWLLTDGEHAWIARNPTGVRHRRGALARLGGGASVRLPPWVYPFAIVGGVLVAQRQDGQDCPCSLVLVNAATGHVHTDLGPRASLVAAGAGLLVWTQGCDPTTDKPCQLDARSVIGGATRTYRLPRPTFGGILRQDGKQVALLLERDRQDPRYESDHPAPPSGIAILNLDTGHLDIAPGIEVPAKTSPSMTFTADGRWLAIAFDAGRKVRLLAWHPGLARPYESAPVAAASTGWAAPPIMAMR